jgi:hypothetical protein
MQADAGRPHDEALLLAPAEFVEPFADGTAPARAWPAPTGPHIAAAPAQPSRQ